MVSNGNNNFSDLIDGDPTTCFVVGQTSSCNSGFKVIVHFTTETYSQEKNKLNKINCTTSLFGLGSFLENAFVKLSKIQTDNQMSI